MRPLLLIVIACAIALACKKEKDVVQYQDGKQLLNVNEITSSGDTISPPAVATIAPDSIAVGNEFLIKIFLAEGANMKIVNAVLECESIATRVVDTTSNRISGCSKGLLVENDTIFIGFRPKELGIKQFPEITILTKDRDKIFRAFSYSFSYKVVPQ